MLQPAITVGFTTVIALDVEVLAEHIELALNGAQIPQSLLPAIARADPSLSPCAGAECAATIRARAGQLQPCRTVSSSPPQSVMVLPVKAAQRRARP